MIIEIPINKSKAIKQFVVFIILLLLFTLMPIQPQLFVKGNNYGLVKVSGYIGSFVFILCAAFVAQKVFSKKPGLIIDNDGITDNSLGVMFAKVRWTDITEIKHLESEGKHYLKISIKEPEKFIAAEPNSMKRRMLDMNYKALKTPINIAVSRLKIGFDELYNKVKVEIEKHR